MCTVPKLLLTHIHVNGRALASAKSDCQSKTNEVTRACVCAAVRVCLPWGPCFSECSNPLYYTCGPLKTVANSLCSFVDVASATVTAGKSTLNAAKHALSLAEVVVREAKITLDAANLVLDGAANALQAAEAVVRAAKVGLDAANLALEASKSAVKAAEAVARSATLAFDAASIVLQGGRKVRLSLKQPRAFDRAIDTWQTLILLLCAFAQVVEQKDLILGAAKLALEAGAIVVENAKAVLDPAIGALDAANVCRQRRSS